MAEYFVGGTVLITILVLVLAVVWIFLPFAMFGMKPILRDLLQEQRRTNELLTAQQQGRPPAG